jgi:hypothetical protein
MARRQCTTEYKIRPIKTEVRRRLGYPHPKRVPAWVLGDAEHHHGSGVHDADEDPGEPGGRIGELSPIIGKVPRMPGRWHFTMGLARSAWGVRRTGAILADRQVPVPTSATVPSHSPYKLITVAGVRVGTRICRCACTWRPGRWW